MAEKKLPPIDWLNMDTLQEGIRGMYGVAKSLEMVYRKIMGEVKNFLNLLSNRYASAFRKQMYSIADTFFPDSFEDYTRSAAIYGQELAAALYQSRLGFESLKTVIIQTAAPIIQLFLPAVQTAIVFLTELAMVARRVVNFLITGSDQMESYSGAAVSAAASTGALKKSLAGFDQINRLNGKSGGIGGIANILTVPDSWKAITQKIKELFKPLQDLDFSAAAASLQRLKAALEPIKDTLFDALEWAWYNIFIPLAEWTVTHLLPEFLDALTAVLEALAYVIEELRPDFIWLWEECLLPLAQWKGEQIIGNLQGIVTELGRTSDWLGMNQAPVDRFIDSLRTMIRATGDLAQETIGLSEGSMKSAFAMSDLAGSVAQMFNPFQDASGIFWLITDSISSLGSAFGDVESAAGDALGVIEQIAGTGWNDLKDNFIDPACSGVRQSSNRLIDFANKLLQGSATGINFLGSAISRLSFTIPAWVPGIGGKGFSFAIKEVKPPQIPYLARGAVLPANRPFMAVVGDQRHGTNIEAPLAVIEQAVATVMEDYANANMAGHEATVGVLQQLLEAVLGISIGDDMIAGAISRHQDKMAVIRGG